jgi:hypothetical protein
LPQQTLTPWTKLTSTHYLPLSQPAEQPETAGVPALVDEQLFAQKVHELEETSPRGFLEHEEHKTGVKPELKMWPKVRLGFGRFGPSSRQGFDALGCCGELAAGADGTGSVTCAL